MSKKRHKIIVGNIGTVYEGYDDRVALREFSEYQDQSKLKYGRAAGESVTWFIDDEIWREHAEPTPYADKFAEFQAALEKYQRAARQSGLWAFSSGDHEMIEAYRETERQAKVHVLKLYNDVLTELQEKEK